MLADLEGRRRPAPDALKDWGLAHRFAGSKDRAAIATLTYDVLRRRASAAWLMDSETPRALLIGMLHLSRGMDEEALDRLFTGERFAPGPIEGAERARLARTLADAPDWVKGDCPEWLMPELARVFAGEVVPEMQALAARAPIDIRTNTLRTERAMLRPKLAHWSPIMTPHAPTGLRFSVDDEGRGPALQATEEFVKGLFEIQDEGSQIVAALAGVAPGDQVIDLCAGGGGKTLELAALMDNRGQIFATDADARRLAPIHDRLSRAGVRNVQVRTPRGRGHDPLADLAGHADLVLVDAPCTGVGTWRRNPDTKWRVRPGALEQRMKEQDEVIARAAGLVRPGGRIAFITCSVLPCENDDRVAAALSRHRNLAVVPASDVLALAPDSLSERRDIETRHGVQLSPRRTGTDGFYLSVIQRR